MERKTNIDSAYLQIRQMSKDRNSKQTSKATHGNRWLPEHVQYCYSS